MVSNNLIKELGKHNIEVVNINKDSISIIYNDIKSDIKISTIRKVFLNSLIMFIDNNS